MSKIDHQYRINEILSFIHKNISADLSVKNLASMAAYSEHYFHRLFKEVTGESTHQYIKRTRLEAAANQLIFSPHLTVRTIAQSCGFESLSSFTRIFKSTYLVTPGEWRSGKEYDDKHYFMSNPEINAAYRRLENAPVPTPQIVDLKPCGVAYVRHKGYNRSITDAWETLVAWAMSHNRSIDHQIAILHSNPALVPLGDCHYVACIGIDKPVTRRGKINSSVIPGGLHAAFKINGIYGELLPYISKILEQWLPNSGYIARTTPAFAIYQKNQYLSKDDSFELTFYLPIGI